MSENGSQCTALKALTKLFISADFTVQDDLTTPHEKEDLRVSTVVKSNANNT